MHFLCKCLLHGDYNESQKLRFTLIVDRINAVDRGMRQRFRSGAEGAEDNGSEKQAEQKEYKDELNIALTAQPPTLDTALTVSAVALDTAGNIFERFYTLNANYEPVPALAESVERSEDGLTYTFALRQGVKFHNGKEMTSEDVVASMNRWLVTSSRAKVR